MSALELHDVVVDYERRGGGLVRAVAGASLSVERGQVIGLVGESGCGKSTLARAAVGLVPISGGSVVFEGEPVSALTRRARPQSLVRLQLVFQNPYSSLNPRRTIGSQIGDGIAGSSRAARAARVGALCELVGLSATAAKRFPHEFSGGQRQRVAIARALAADPSVIVLDEPLASLDASAQAQLANLLRDLSRDLGLGLLLISHDLAIVRHVADTVSVMYLGTMVETGPTLPLWTVPAHPYSEALIAAVPRPDGLGFLPESLPGEVPDPAYPPSGCRFHPRCAFAFDRCSVEAPPLVTARRGPNRSLLAPSGGLGSGAFRRAGRQHRGRNARRIRSTRNFRQEGILRKHFAARRSTWLLPFAAAAALACAAAAYGATGHATGAPTLVVDNSFTIKTSDPQRAFDPTASIIDRALYDTLFTYKGGNLSNPIPLLVSSWKATNNAKVFTFQLKRNVHFADGTPLTSADVVWSLDRLVNLKGNPAFLLAGVTVKAAGKYGVVMTSTTPATQLPAILANPSTGIVNSKLVKAHGGSDAANASTADKAENFLNSSASAGAGSGPYILKAFSTTSQITLVPNTHYWGARKPAFSNVVVRNMIATTQLINIQRGSHEVAIDLAADQAAGLKGNKKLKRFAAAVDVDVLAVRQRQPGDLVGHLEQAVPDGRPLRARLQVDPVGRGPRRHPGTRESSRRCSSARCRRRTRSSRTS